MTERGKVHSACRGLVSDNGGKGQQLMYMLLQGGMDKLDRVDNAFERKALCGYTPGRP